MHHNSIQYFRYGSYTKIGLMAVCLPSVQYCQLVCHLIFFFFFHYIMSFTFLFSCRIFFSPWVFRKVPISTILLLGSELGTTSSLSVCFSLSIISHSCLSAFSMYQLWSYSVGITSLSLDIITTLAAVPWGASGPALPLAEGRDCPVLLCAAVASPQALCDFGEYSIQRT